MNQLDIALGLLCLMVAFFPALFVGVAVAVLVPATWTGVAVCLVVVALIAKVTDHFIDPGGYMLTLPFLVSAISLSITTLPAYSLVSWAQTKDLAK